MQSHAVTTMKTEQPYHPSPDVPAVRPVLVLHLGSHRAVSSVPLKRGLRALRRAGAAGDALAGESAAVREERRSRTLGFEFCVSTGLKYFSSLQPLKSVRTVPISRATREHSRPAGRALRAIPPVSLEWHRSRQPKGLPVCAEPLSATLPRVGVTACPFPLLSGVRPRACQCLSGPWGVGHSPCGWFPVLTATGTALWTRT